jgi:hypothetical protein
MNFDARSGKSKSLETTRTDVCLHASGEPHLITLPRRPHGDARLSFFQPKNYCCQIASAHADNLQSRLSLLHSWRLGFAALNCYLVICQAVMQQGQNRSLSKISGNLASLTGTVSMFVLALRGASTSPACSAELRPTMPATKGAGCVFWVRCFVRG